MMQFLGFDDNKKIGMLLLALSIICYILGMILFFHRALLILSNVLFLFGLYFFIGFTGIVKFFVKKGKIKGSLVYFIGFLVLVIGFSFFGAILQIIGFFLIFKSFLPDFYDYLCRVPYVGKYIKSYWLQNFLDKVAGNRQSRI